MVVIVIDVPPETQHQRTERGRDRAHGKTIPATCQIHGARGYCNLLVRKTEGDIVLDPHVSGQCVIVLDEKAATALFDLLSE